MAEEMKLTIAYTTYRKEPHIQWFYDSLESVLPDGVKPKLVIVDALWKSRDYPLAEQIPSTLLDKLSDFVVTAPKPSVWQGEHRLTKVDFFSASNARNTALVHAGFDDHIAYVDDLSVLMPTWFEPILEHAPKNSYHHNTVVSGSFSKAKNMVVDKGVLTNYVLKYNGLDYRWSSGRDDQETKMHGGLLLGCTSLWPVQALLHVNGWPENLCDGLGFEDSMLGTVAHNGGVKFLYSRRMHEVESEDCHYEEIPYKRIDPGRSPFDKSHSVRDICGSLNKFKQDFGNGINTIADLMLHMKRGNPWPIPKVPTHEWWSKMKLCDFHSYQI